MTLHAKARIHLDKEDDTCYNACALLLLVFTAGACCSAATVIVILLLYYTCCLTIPAKVLLLCTCCLIQSAPRHGRPFHRLPLPLSCSVAQHAPAAPPPKKCSAATCVWSMLPLLGACAWSILPLSGAAPHLLTNPKLLPLLPYLSSSQSQA